MHEGEIPGRLLLGDCRGLVKRQILAVRVKRFVEVSSSSSRFVPFSVFARLRILSLRKQCRATSVFRHLVDPSFLERQPSSREKRPALTHHSEMSWLVRGWQRDLVLETQSQGG